MPKAPLSITSPKIKKLAIKALKSPSVMTTAEKRDLGASVLAHLQPPDMAAVKGSAKKTATKKNAAKKIAGKKTSGKKAAAKKTSAKR